MDKKLQAYIKYIEVEAKHPSAELITFHRDQVQQFQHERLIHLIVTMFFASFLLLCFGVFLYLDTSADLAQNIWGELICGGVGVITLILLITTLFYIRHYYLLENGTQKLEDYTRILAKRDYFTERK